MIETIDIVALWLSIGIGWFELVAEEDGALVGTSGQAHGSCGGTDRNAGSERFERADHEGGESAEWMTATDEGTQCRTDAGAQHPGP